jgi:hypothetical protein
VPVSSQRAIRRKRKKVAQQRATRGPQALLLKGHNPLLERVHAISYSECHKHSSSQDHKLFSSECHKLSSSKDHKLFSSKCHKLSSSKDHKLFSSECYKRFAS